MTVAADKVLYLDGASQPITFRQFEDRIIEASDSIASGLKIVEGIRSRQYDDDRAMLMGAIIVLKHALALVDNLQPDGFLLDDSDALDATNNGEGSLDPGLKEIERPYRECGQIMTSGQAARPGQKRSGK